MSDSKANADRERLVGDLVGSTSRSGSAWRWALAGMFFLGAYLLAFVPISSGVPAHGIVQPTKPRQEIQHQTGGVIKRVLVKDGQRVKAGQSLVQLEDAQERAAFSVAKFQALSLRAELAVRQAEVLGQKVVDFPEDLMALAGRDRDVRAIIDAQIAAFEARKQSNANQTAQLHQEVEKTIRASAQARARASATAKQLALVREEAATMQMLLAKGLTLKSRVLALERAKADLAGQTTAFSAEVERLNAERVGLVKRKAQPEMAARVQASEAMRTVISDLTAAQDRYLAAQAALDRTVLRAPIDGTVLSLRTVTVGGVLRPGDSALELVPADNELQLKAKIILAHSDNINVGDETSIRFDLAQGTAAPTITGRVSTISADAVEDPRTGETYFEAKIAIPPNEAERVPAHVLAPGRPAEVLIKTGERTLLSHFLVPIEQARFRAMREE